MCGYSDCPRCGLRTLERLKTYAHCANCLLFEDYHEDNESMFFKAARIEQEFLENDREECAPDAVQETA